jgi:uncharacterized protein
MGDLPIHLQKAKIRGFCQKYHIDSLALFGSVLTSHFNEASDVDVLVRFNTDHIPHLFGLIKMESELSDIFGYRVDLKTPNDLSPYFRDEVIANAKIIYGE